MVDRDNRSNRVPIHATKAIAWILETSTPLGIVFLVVFGSLGCNIAKVDEKRPLPGYGRRYIVVNSNDEFLQGWMLASTSIGGRTLTRAFCIRDGVCDIPAMVESRIGGVAALPHPAMLIDGIYMFLVGVDHGSSSDLMPVVPGYVTPSGRVVVREESGKEKPIPRVIRMKRASIREEHDWIYSAKWHLDESASTVAPEFVAAIQSYYERVWLVFKDLPSNSDGGLSPIQPFPERPCK
jgi:hypothetical protein